MLMQFKPILVEHQSLGHSSGTDTNDAKNISVAGLQLCLPPGHHLPDFPEALPDISNCNRLAQPPASMEHAGHMHSFTL